VTTPGVVSPANGALLANASQPITITVNNAFVSSSTDLVTYTFEVATDAAFANKVLAKDVAQKANQTSVTLDLVPPGKDYYWHVRTKSGDTVGVFTNALKFTVGPAVSFEPPVAVSPEANESVSPRATFTVANATRTGPAGQVTYRFEVAATLAFNPILASGVQPEGSGQTSFTVTQNLPEETNLVWRAQAVDAANAASSAFSTPRAFRTTVTIDLHTVNYQRFVNPADWSETDRIIKVDQDGGLGYMCINHTKRGIWPPAPFLGDPDTATEGTQWYFARINGQWYGGAGEWVRPNQICKSGQTSAEIGPDGGWGGPMSKWVPKVGELVGYMMTTPARSYPLGRTLDERSDVVVVPWKVNGVTTPSSVRGVR
jgi:hypothetical protein